ncbi:hypothetical protein, partial [Symmachiella dynata]
LTIRSCFAPLYARRLENQSARVAAREKFMEVYFVCKSHKQVISVGDADLAHKLVFHHNWASSSAILEAITRFIREHVECDAGWMSEKSLYDMELFGYRRVDNQYGIPFKGPDYMTIDEATQAMRERAEGDDRK